MDASDREEAAQILKVAFVTSPLLRWMYPSPKSYLTHAEGFMNAYSGDPYRSGSGVIFENESKGVLLWRMPDDHADVGCLHGYLEHSVVRPRRADAIKLFGQLGQYHPQQPYLYLTLIGIDPLRQNQGLAEMLFCRAFQICDELGIPAYSESSSESATRLYERIGLRVIDEVQVGTTPPIFPLLRKPRSNGRRVVPAEFAAAR
ncbi:GNAT family N-acetyltransferase [Paraburkholderia sp. BR14262]|uniref:GNAT family N-acetyltransferase n=1 Tax=Paraburkholderia sp. BR14262 TaxID=3236999 RepID=UPI0034CEC0AF